jgi:hypothetical protein
MNIKKIPIELSPDIKISDCESVKNIPTNFVEELLDIFKFLDSDEAL